MGLHAEHQRAGPARGGVSAPLQPASCGEATGYRHLAEAFVGHGAMLPGHSLEIERLVDQKHGSFS